MDARTWLCSRGHVATANEFRQIGVTARRLTGAVASGRLLRLSRGTYACTHVDSRLESAARSGCLIDCVTALSRHDKQWSGIHPAGLHLRALPGRHHGALPPDAVVHWRRQVDEPAFREVSIVDALLQAMHCLTPYDALACVESALHLGTLSEPELVRLVQLAPQWMRPTLLRLDRGSHSGLETHTRLPLQDAGHVVETQVPIPGTSDLDLLVDGLVGVETDGEKWHSARFIHDRSKDIVIEGWSIRVLRIGAPHVFEGWPDTLATIEQMIRDARRA